ncbi:MAG TPA: glycosyltransferase family 2 protein [Conexibacter sp.]|nr:glycosyltransferase family 2 protein [Conexibacter sp.]
MTPELSVVIPSRNRWPLLQRALASALAQRDVELEVLVVDDGSTDDSAERAEAVPDARVRVLRQPRGGVAAARNSGVEHAAAAWVALLDDDDVWAQDKCRRQLDALAARDAQIAYTSAVVTDAALAFKRVLPAPDPDRVLATLLGSNTIGTPSSVIASREALLASGGFDPSLSVLADWDMWLRLCPGRRAAACPEPLVAYVEHDANLHVVDTGAVLREFAVLRRRHSGLAAAHGVKLGDVDWWRWIASSHRRAGRRPQAALAYLGVALRFRSGRDVARALAVLGGERAMRRLARPPSPPDAQRRREWAWIEGSG